MFTVSFQASAVAIAQIFAMGALGFALVRARIINEAGLKLLSFLSVNITFPMFIFCQIIRHLDPVQTPQWWQYPLINISMAAVAIGLTLLIMVLSQTQLETERMAASCFHNAGYIPLLLTMTLPLGDLQGKVHTAVLLSIIGFDLCLWSLGVWFMTRQRSARAALKNMINPPLLSMVLGVVFVLLGRDSVPVAILKPLELMGDSAMAMAMLVIGGNLALTQFENMNVREVGAAAIIKLVLVPLVVLGLMSLFKVDPIIGFVAMVQACMPTSMSLSIIGRNFGSKNLNFVNQTIFATHLLCVVTLPMFLGLYGRLKP